MQDISKLRKSYERAELSETDSAADPFKQFEGWYKKPSLLNYQSQMP